MYKKRITFEDFNGRTLTEDHYFHLNEKELTQYVVTNGDYTFDKVLERYREEKNGKELMKAFDDLLHLSYGKKSLDGRRFEKSEEIWKEFSETEAYSVFFMELITDVEAASEFVNGVIPQKVAAQIKELAAKDPESIPEDLKSYMGASNA